MNIYMIYTLWTPFRLKGTDQGFHSNIYSILFAFKSSLNCHVWFDTQYASVTSCCYSSKWLNTTVQHNGRFTLFSSKFVSNIYSILFKLCRVNRPILLNKWLNNLIIKCFYVVFLSYSFLDITVVLNNPNQTYLRKYHFELMSCVGIRDLSIFCNTFIGFFVILQIIHITFAQTFWQIVKIPKINCLKIVRIY